MKKQSNQGTLAQNKRHMGIQINIRGSEELQGYDFELKIWKKLPITDGAPVYNGTTEISVKWSVNIVVFSCNFTIQ